MKHTLQVTLVLVAVFILIQVFGLYVIYENMSLSVAPSGDTVVDYDDTVVGERPDIEGAVSLAYLLLGILIGTGLIMMFVRFGQVRLWKGMYFLAIWLSSSITLGVFAGPAFAFLAALALAVVKLFRPNVFTHNLTEVFIYPGIAVLFVPLFNITWGVILLLAISCYDMFAVWKSGHMVSLAKFQTSSRAFAGFVIPYSRKGITRVTKKVPRKIKSGSGVKTAILGGGDIAFPLLFSGIALDWLITSGMSSLSAFMSALMIPLFSAGALLFLFMKAEKDRFYPAMPFISAGCFAGLAAAWMLSILF